MPEKKEKKTTKRPAKKKIAKAKKYIEAIGRRKTAVARVRLFSQASKDFVVNNKKSTDYFSDFANQELIVSPLNLMNVADKFKITVQVKGGGLQAQAEAIRHGLARALVKFNPEFRKRLKKAGFLTRDPRMRERKKFGLKRARRAPQWSKR